MLYYPWTKNKTPFLCHFSFFFLSDVHSIAWTKKEPNTPKRPIKLKNVNSLILFPPKVYESENTIKMQQLKEFMFDQGKKCPAKTTLHFLHWFGIVSGFNDNSNSNKNQKTCVGDEKSTHFFLYFCVYLMWIMEFMFLFV